MSLGYISRASGLRPAVVATMAMTLMNAHVDVVAVQKDPEERIHGNEIYSKGNEWFLTPSELLRKFQNIFRKSWVCCST